MNVQSRPWPAAVALALGLTMSACTIGTPASGETPSSVDRKKDRKHAKANAKKGKATNKAAAAPKPKPKPKPKAKPRPKPEPKQVWVCSWSPTFDDDRHNDVECANGIATERPYLRTWDDVIEKRELMESAREYARQRNAG